MTDGGNTESSRFGILRKRVEERLNINDDTLEHFGVNPGILPLRYKRRKAAEDVRMELKYAVDSLTGLLSKDFFNETIKTSVAQAERDLSMSPLGLAIIDIDHFGKFNKDFGIPTGDEVLASVEDAMHTKMRETSMPAPNITPATAGPMIGPTLPMA